MVDVLIAGASSSAHSCFTPAGFRWWTCRVALRGSRGPESGPPDRARAVPGRRPDAARRVRRTPDRDATRHRGRERDDVGPGRQARRRALGLPRAWTAPGRPPPTSRRRGATRRPRLASGIRCRSGPGVMSRTPDRAAQHQTPSMIRRPSESLLPRPGRSRPRRRRGVGVGRFALGIAVDVDAPAGEPRGQPRVLPLAADRE